MDPKEAERLLIRELPGIPLVTNTLSQPKAKKLTRQLPHFPCVARCESHHLPRLLQEKRAHTLPGDFHLWKASLTQWTA